MGSSKEEKDAGECNTEQQMRVKTCIAYSWSLMVSMFGGLTLGLWEYAYHPTNTQLWMVPFGLVLLITPLFVFFSIFFSDACKVDDVPKKSQPVHLHPPPSLNSVCDPER